MKWGMYHLFFLVSIISALMVSANGAGSDPEPEDELNSVYLKAHGIMKGMDEVEVKKLALRNTRFAMNLYNFVRERTKSSFFFSPFSISSMLAMAYLGTGSNTHDEIGNVLEFHDIDNVHDVFRQTFELIFTHYDHFTILIANRLFARTDYNFKHTYNENATRYYRAGLEELDFAGKSIVLFTKLKIN